MTGRDEFMAEYLGTFTTHPITVCDELAAEYFSRTEIFDREVLTGVVMDGERFAADRHELALSNRHANSVLHELYERAEEEGFTREQLRHAMRVHIHAKR